MPGLPGEAMAGDAECSAAYTGSALLSCTSGSAVLTPYGWRYSPGSCYDYSWARGAWGAAGGRQATYRRGARLVRVGALLLALGGRKRGRSYRSVEVVTVYR
jgi:hypothetical protein